MKKILMFGMLMVLLVPVAAHAVTVDLALIMSPVAGSEAALIDPKEAALGLGVKLKHPITDKTHLFLDASMLGGTGVEAKGSMGFSTSAVSGLPDGVRFVGFAEFTSIVDGCFSCRGDSLSTFAFKLVVPIKK